MHAMNLDGSIGKLRITISLDHARAWLALLQDVLAGDGCQCVQAGKTSETCQAVFDGARIARHVYLDNAPNLAAQLRDAAECVLAREHPTPMPPNTITVRPRSPA